MVRIWAATSENRSSGFPTRSDTNQAVQPQKMARGLKFCIQEGEGLYYPCSENKDADQFRGDREADLRLCFRICKNPVFSRRGSYIYSDVKKCNHFKFITQTCPCIMQGFLDSIGINNFSMKTFYIFLIFAQNIDWGNTLELPYCDRWIFRSLSFGWASPLSFLGASEVIFQLYFIFQWNSCQQTE